MDRERISRALERIEAAAGRIERCAAKPSRPEDSEISEKYEQLRRETSAAVADLDGLIERLAK